MADFVVICGLSGAGRSEAAKHLEDLGWFVIDNLPTELIAKVAELAIAPGSSTDHVALVVGSEAPSEVARAIEHLEAMDDVSVRTLFLRARVPVLVRRYEATRRRHPFHDAGSLAGAIAAESEALEPLRAAADVVVDTSELNVHQLRDRIVELFPVGANPLRMQTRIVSFGFKNGVPLDVDMVFDCRFLPNPHWVDELRPLTGRDPAVRDHVLEAPAARRFLDLLDEMFGLLLPAYVAEGKSYLTIAFGCTGGQHRSVAIAEEMRSRLAAHGFEAGLTHRDMPQRDMPNGPRR